MRHKKPVDPRSVRQRHEEAIADLVRRREALEAQLAGLEAKSRDTGAEVVTRTLDLLALMQVLEEIHEDAEWIRRKAAIRSRVRDLAEGRVVPSLSGPTKPALPAGLSKQLHEQLDRIQRDNLYAHVSGNYTDKTALQNSLLERYGDLVDVRWDGEKLLLLEFEGRSAGHMPVECLSPAARRAVAKRLGLSAPG